ncbi:MAG: TolC family protein [Saprospiraceae bacterium]
MSRILVVCFLLWSPYFLVAQAPKNKWSLEECITYAQDNNLTIKQAQYNIANAQLNVQQSKLNRFPSVSGSVSAGNQYGRTIDPVTNSFETQTIGFNSYTLSGGITLFNGNVINNTVKQNKLNLEAAQLDASAAANDIGLSIAVAYLNILLSEELLTNAERRLELSQEQLNQINKQIEAGVLPEAAKYDVLAQVALDQQSVVDAGNAVAINLLTLQQFMLLEPSEEFDIVRPELAFDLNNLNTNFRVNEVYTQALSNQPQVLAADRRAESAELGIAVAKGSLYPSLNLFGSLSSNYSSLGRTILGSEMVTSSQTFRIGGAPVEVEFDNVVPIVGKNPYFDQIEENFGQSVGMSLQIPIFSNGRNRINVERAQIGLLNSQAGNLQVRQQLKANIQRAITDTQSSAKSLEAAQQALEAAEIALNNAQKRFEIGSINNFEFTTARNNFDRATADFTRARYQYLFNLKTIEFYQGKGLSL